MFNKIFCLFCFVMVFAGCQMTPRYQELMVNQGAELEDLRKIKDNQISELSQLKEKFAALETQSAKEREQSGFELARAKEQIETLKKELGITNNLYEEYKKAIEIKLNALQLERNAIIKQLELSKAEKIQQLSDENQKIRDELAKIEAANQFTVKETQKGIEITFLDRILFDAGKAELKSEGLAAMNNVAQILNKYSTRDIVIEGHTDNVPIKTAEFPSNWELSAARGISVLKFLLNNGQIEKKRLSFQGFADTKPVADNKTEEGRRLNRRVEIILLPENLQILKIQQ